MKDDALERFEAERPALMALAYRMLGERAGAEDVVQEAWLRWSRQDHASVQSPAAWLRRTTARLAIDALRRSKARREVYVGPWLPEPILGVAPGDGAEPGSAEDAYRLAQECELALLWAMERLDAEERAAFILRSAFDADYADIAALLGKSEAACRQIVSRASRRVKAQAPRFQAPPDARAELLRKFSEACAAQDKAAVLALLAPTVTAISDGGGKARAALRPLHGRDEVAQVALAAAAKGYRDPKRAQWVMANGAPAMVLLSGSEKDTVMSVTIDADGLIDWIYILRNPEKLATIEPDLARWRARPDG